MFFDDRKAITTIMSKRDGKGNVTMSPTPVKPESHKDEDRKMDGRHAAAEDILGAHHEKSPGRLMEALANFIDLHLHEAQGNKPEPEGKEPNRPSLS